MAPPSMCVSSATTKHRSGTLLYRRLWSSAAWAHRSCASRLTFMTENPIALSTREREDSRHVREIPWPSGQWRAGRRIDTGHAGRIHGREHARGHVQPCCRGGGGVGQIKGVPPPPPQRRRPAVVVQRLRAGPLPRRAAHLRAADTAHGRGDAIDHSATGRL